MTQQPVTTNRKMNIELSLPDWVAGELADAPAQFPTLEDRMSLVIDLPVATFNSAQADRLLPAYSSGIPAYWWRWVSIASCP
ncbi:MAG: hypothetical protein R3C44_21560 [Chloroflexota bacterium]